MDPFKKYLHSHRDDLDVEKPPSPELWQRIQQKAPPAQKPVFSLMQKWVAAACVVLLAGIAVYWFWLKPAAPPAVTYNEKPAVKEPDTMNTLPYPATNEKIIVAETKVVKQPSVTVRPKVNKKKVVPQSPIDAVEANYATIINYQLKRLERTPIYAESPAYFHMFKKQWYDLEKDEDKIKQDVQVYGLSDRGIDQLIQLYQQKMSLLKQLQNEINKMNNRTKNRPAIRQKKPAYLKM